MRGGLVLSHRALAQIVSAVIPWQWHTALGEAWGNQGRDLDARALGKVGILARTCGLSQSS